MARRVLITGADGFVGAHLARRLLDHGATVGAFVRKIPDCDSSGLRTWGIDRRVVLCVGDVRDPSSVENALRLFRPEFVFHLAAVTIIQEAEAAVHVTYETNVRGTYNVVCAASQHASVQGVIVASSDKAYGDWHGTPYRETMPVRGGGVYDSSKAAAELAAMSASRAMGISLGVTRCSNIYGPGDHHYTRIVPDTCRALALGRRPRIRGDGSHRRDFMFVEDAVAGYLRLGERMSRDRVPRVHVYNFGTGRGVSILDIVQQLVEYNGTPELWPDVLALATPVEILEQCVDPTNAIRDLDWQPQTRLAEGLTRTLRWYQQAGIGRGADA